MPSAIVVSILGAGSGIAFVAHPLPLWEWAVELLFIVAFVLMVRAMRAGVYADRERVRVRSLWRTRTVLLTDISSITSAPRRGDLSELSRSDVLHVVLHSGETIRTPLRIRNPSENDKAGGAVYERDEYIRIKHHLGALVHNRMLDDPE